MSTAAFLTLGARLDFAVGTVLGLAGCEQHPELPPSLTSGMHHLPNSGNQNYLQTLPDVPL